MATHPPVSPIPGRSSGHVSQRYRRSRRSELAIWWREIDRVLLLLVLALMGIGTVAVAAASPAAANRLSKPDVKLDDLHFFMLHIRWQLLGLATMLGVSQLSKDMARRLGIAIAASMLVALILVPLIGVEVNGARRWINLGMQFQPSEFLKPGFAIGLAWILSWRMRDPNLPVVQISVAVIALVAGLLMMQPDFGSTILFVSVWFALVLLSGLSLKRIMLIGAAGLVAVGLTLVFYGNARRRITEFFGGGSAFDQVALAQRTLLEGGWTGRGLWLGTRKMSLPEAHTDYIFSVIGEEFGLLVCALIVVLYLAVAVRVLLRLVEEEDLFTVLAAAGLTVQLGAQAFINIFVNLQLFPSKGMTLPLISYGGSSTIAICLGVGLLLAITRRNPFIGRERVTWRDIGEDA